jgi:hypothetical protein
LLVSIAAARADEPILLRAALSPGNSLRYEAEAKLQVTSEKLSQTVEQRLTLRFTVARADQNGALVRGRIESLKVKAEGGGAEAQEFAWTEGEGPGAEQDGGLAGLYRQLGGTIFEITLDGSGKIESVTGLERVRDETMNVTNASRLMGILSPEAAPRMLQGVFALDTDGKKRSQGESWVSTQEFNAGIWQAKAKTEYTLRSVSSGLARVTGAVTILPPPASEGEDLRPKPTIVSQSCAIEAAWDANAGRLVSGTTDGKVVWKGTLPLKEPIEATATSESRVSFKFLGEDAPPKPAR